MRTSRDLLRLSPRERTNESDSNPALTAGPQRIAIRSLHDSPTQFLRSRPFSTGFPPLPPNHLRIILSRSIVIQPAGNRFLPDVPPSVGYIECPQCRI